MCKFCESFDFGMVGYRYDGDRGMVYFPSHGGKIPSKERFKFCPVCGRDLSATGAKDMKLEFVKHQEVDREGKHYARDTYTIDEYTIEVDDTIYEDGAIYHRISVIRSYNRIGEEQYIPEINYCDGYFEHREPHFSIQTTSYGSLESEDYKLFLEAQKKAEKVVEILTNELLNPKGENDI